MAGSVTCSAGLRYRWSERFAAVVCPIEAALRLEANMMDARAPGLLKHPIAHKAGLASIR